jgi:predicted amidohydrolase
MRIAVAQTPGATLDEWQQTLATLADLIAQAGAAGADLVVLPECAFPAYWLGARRAYTAARAAGLPGPDRFMDFLLQQARSRHIMICAGYVEEQPAGLYNAAALIDADGQCRGVHRKCFLWDFDHDQFLPGDALAVWDTPLGRIGMMICADARLPEIPATLAARGAQLVLQPTAWVNAGDAARPWNPQPDFLISARAREFGYPLASASKWGVEGNTTFVGSSLICAADGHVAAQCGPTGTGIAVADVTLGAPRAPQVSDAERTRLLATTAPRLPRRTLGPLRVVVVPPGMPSAAACPKSPGSAVSISTDIPTLVITSEAQHSAYPASNERRLVLTGPSAAPLILDDALVGALAAKAADHFAPARLLGLAGAGAVVFFGDDVNMAALQTRACENRIFTLSAGHRGGCACDPTGRITCRWDWSSAPGAIQTLTLDLARAADKHVAPRTDMIAGRQVEHYEF